MIAFICNHCKKPIDMEKKHCVHIKISYGEKAIINKGQYANGWDADLCEECWNKLCPMIDEYYYGGNKHLIDHPTEKGGRGMAKLVEAVKCAEIISEKFNIPLADLVDVFAEISTANNEDYTRTPKERGGDK